MIARQFNRFKDYPDLCVWWNRHKWPRPPIESLPFQGIVIEDEKHKYCAAFIYLTDSNLGWFEYLVSNPDAPLKKKVEAIKLLIKTGISEASKMGIGRLFVTLSNEKLVKLFKEAGYVVGDERMTNLIARVEP